MCIFLKLILQQLKISCSPEIVQQWKSERYLLFSDLWWFFKNKKITVKRSISGNLGVLWGSFRRISVQTVTTEKTSAQGKLSALKNWTCNECQNVSYSVAKFISGQK